MTDTNTPTLPFPVQTCSKCGYVQDIETAVDLRCRLACPLCGMPSQFGPEPAEIEREIEQK